MSDASAVKRYVVCGCTPWARRVFDQTLSKLPGQWSYIATPDELVPLAQAISPHTIFFVHWRWKVPDEIVSKFTCIGFHVGKLPQERGGTPVQWRMLSEATQATVTMFRLTSELDAGPILDEGEIALDGPAELVYGRMADWAAACITEYVMTEGHAFEPRAQEGTPEVFPRRTPEDSRLLGTEDLLWAYDRIRAVDAPGYPLAFLDCGRLRLTFRRAVLYDGRIEADVTITEREDG